MRANQRLERPAYGRMDEFDAMQGVGNTPVATSEYRP